VEARDEQLSGVEYRGLGKNQMSAGIEDMLDRVSVLARGMRVVLCNKAKSDPLRSAMGHFRPR